MKYSLLAIVFAVLVLFAGTAQAQDIIATVAPNAAGSDNRVDIRNPSSGRLHIQGDPAPSAARMSRMNSGLTTEYPWPSIPNFAPDPDNQVFNRIFPGDSLRVYSKTLPANTVITIPFTYGPSGTTYNFRVTVTSGALVTAINTLDPSPTSAASVRWRVTFSAPVSNVTAGNFAFNTGGGDITGVSVASVTPDSAQPSASWTVTVNTGSGGGLLGLNWAGHQTETPSVPNSFTGALYTISLRAPVIVQDLPLTIGVNRNTTTTLAIVASSRDGGPLYYQWYSTAWEDPNPVVISGATSASYTPPNFTNYGSYKFHCRVYPDPSHPVNNVTKSSTATIIVVDPPQITNSPAGTLLVTGQSATLAVSAVGTDLKYQWYQGNAPDTSNIVSGATSASFTTPTLTGSRSYWVRVTNIGPTIANSATAAIRIVSSVTPSGSYSATVNVVFPNVFVATARDSSGNPMSSVPITFTAPASGATGRFAGNAQAATVNTDSNGVATAPVFTANGNAGTYNVVANFSALSGNLPSSNLPTFNSATLAGLTNTDSDSPYSLATVTGATPGGSFSGPGVSGGTFTPANAGRGTHTINYSVNGAQAAFSITVTETPTLIVNTVTDAADRFDGLRSLRETVAYANSLGGPQTITFVPALAGQTVTVNTGWNDANDTTALRVTGQLLLQGLTSAPGVTIATAQGVQKRHLLVESSGNLTVSHLTFKNGYSDFGGSIRSFGSLAIRNCTFTGNHASGDGGAVHGAADSPSLLIENSTFTGNSTSTVASAVTSGAQQNIYRYLTITNNSGGTGAIDLYQYPATILNSIVAGNSPDGIVQLNGGAFSAQSTNNILGSGGTGGLTNGANGNLTSVSAAKLYLGSLANNGGPTQTIALLPASPAINCGVAIAGLTTDQRGSTRTAGNAPDAGAFEDPAGNDDPDGDSLGNAQEYTSGTNPLVLDSDGDGFNDATELMAGSNPNSSTSVPTSTHVERVLGYGAARGLDLTGNFIYAVNIGTNGAAGQAGDATFTSDNAFGVTLVAPGEIANWAVRDFGNTAGDNALETVYRSIRWADTASADPNLRKLRVDLANIVPGRKYKLQLLFAESADWNRHFDVFVAGQLIADDFYISGAQGIPVRPTAAAAIVHEFTATGTTLNIVLDGANISVPAVDRNPLLNGVTLEDLSAAPPLINPSSNAAYENSVQVSIVNNAPGTMIRYTTDGSTPNESTGTIYSGPFTLTNSATVRAVAYGNGFASSQVISASYAVLPPLPYWRTLQGLAADGAQDLANPSGDGVSNLAKYAFNLAPNAGDLNKPNAAILTPNGAAGLPLIGFDEQGRLTIAFVRRKASGNPGITYTVETGENLNALATLNLGAAMVVSIDSKWERVTVIDPIVSSKRFARVRIDILAP